MLRAEPLAFKILVVWLALCGLVRTSVAQSPQRPGFDTDNIVFNSGQDFDDLVRRFDHIMQERHGEAVIVQRWSTVAPGASTYVNEWRIGEERLRIEADVCASFGVAMDRMRQRAAMYGVPTRPIAGYGDDGLLLGPYTPNGAGHLILRWGSVVVDVTAPDRFGIDHFARLFLTEVGRAARPPRP